jgi:hypothetical protein
MTTEWRTDEPEANRWITYKDNTVLRFLKDGMCEYPCGKIEPRGPYFKLEEWKYLASLEEERLRQRVQELQDGISQHRFLVTGITMPTDQCSAIDQGLWNLLKPIQREEGQDGPREYYR